MSEVVSYERRGAVGVVTVDYPPVNALNVKVRAGLAKCLAEAQADTEAKAVVLACQGRTFIAGADITEFGKPAEAPELQQVIDALDDFPKPVVAALHGTALGGGFEVALACHYRVAVPSAKVGLPEVNLGLIPGAGGTQRLPRLVGCQAALEMITSGAPISAKRAKELGAVDAIVEGDLLSGAVAFAEQVVAGGSATVRARDKPCPAPATLFSDFAKKVAKDTRGFEAPKAAVAAVEAASSMSFAAGLERERELFTGLARSAQSAALRYLFFAEREVAKIPEITAATPRTAIEKVGVIGAGTMGGGIAMALLNAGLEVVMVEAQEAALDRGTKAIATTYDGSVQKGKLSADERTARLSRLAPSLSYEALADADLIIEAVFEEMSVKRQVFEKLDAVAKPSAILATNTSSLDVDAIAAVTKRPEKVIGLHFFSPANIMKLVEVVRGKHTDLSTVASAMDFTKALGKVGVLVGVCFGFVGNRMLFQYTREAEFLLEEGATPEQIDRVIYDFGLAMGPFQMSDVVGLDTLHRIRKEQPPLAGLRSSALIDELVAAGRLGQKNGKGFYTYEGRAAKPDPEVTRLIEACARRAGIARRAISDDEIRERCLFPILNEGFKLLEEGIALRPEDIDVIWIYGYGFPRYRGGPMCHADQLGLPHLLERLKHYQGRHGDLFKPAALLERLVAEGKKVRHWRAGA